jgi:hypothetical protein
MVWLRLRLTLRLQVSNYNSKMTFVRRFNESAQGQRGLGRSCLTQKNTVRTEYSVR